MKRNIIKILLVSLAMLTACNQGPTKNEKFKLLYNYYHAAVVEQGETPLSYDEWITYNNIDETKEFETRVNGEQVEWKYTTEDDTKWRPVVIITKKCDHAWDDGVVTIEPTCISQGEKEYTCSKCSEKKTESIPIDPYAHEYEEGECIHCGDIEVFIEDLAVTNDKNVMLYSDDIEGYLADDTPNVRDHNYKDYGYSAQGGKKIYKPVVISWTSQTSPRTGFKILYSLNEDFSDALEENVDKDARSANLYNLLIGKTYYIKVIGDFNDAKHYGVSSLTTYDKAPRVMHVDGIENVRDIGGYETPYGKTLEQLVIRGGSLTNTEGSAIEKTFKITEKGKIQMRDHLKIKNEFELRSGYIKTVLYDAKLQSFPVKSYADAIDDIANKSSTWKKLFQAFAKKESYPLYIHCTAGADRTGTVCYLLKTLLGVSEIDCIHDHELTSFSAYGIRDRDYGGSSQDKEKKFTLNALIEEINLKSTGSTMMEKVENLILGLGVTADEIASIRAIHLGKTIEEIEQIYIH